MTKFDSIENVIDAFSQGEKVIILDDEDRENEADIIQAATRVTGEDVNFMIRLGRGLVCVALPPERVEQLELPMMPSRGRDPMGTAFTTSIDARDTHTGISAYERAHTISLLADPCAGPDMFFAPGHVFGLKARPGGVLERPGHTETAVDLGRICGHDVPAGTICEIIHRSGKMVRRDDALQFASRFGLKAGTVKQLIEYRLRTETLVTEDSRAFMPTEFGQFNMISFTDVSGDCHLALVPGSRKTDLAPLVRIHSECLTGDALGSLRCDCRSQLEQSLSAISRHGNGALIYLRQEGRGIGLKNKIRAYSLQDKGLDTVDANLAQDLPVDSRSYVVAAHILKHLGLTEIDLLSNNPSKKSELEAYGVRVRHLLPVQGEITEHNQNYLECKQNRLGHIMKG